VSGTDTPESARHASLGRCENSLSGHQTIPNDCEFSDT